MAFSSRMVMEVVSRVSRIRFPTTSSRSRSVASLPILRRTLGDQRLGRLPVDLLGRDRDELLFRVAECGESATEHAAGVDADGPVEPDGLGDGRVAVDDGGPAPVVLGPRVPHREPVLVGLSGGVAVEGEGAHRARGPALHVLGQSGVGDHQVALVQHVVADQPVDEGGDPGRELRRLCCQLLEALGQAVGGGDLAALQGPQELDLVIAGDARAEPSATMPMTRPRTAGVAGPRSTRSPRKQPRRPAG